MALPAPINRPLYRYTSRAGCWGYEENGQDLRVKFDPSKLEPLHIDIPLYSVNRKARDVAIKYIKQQNLQQSDQCAQEFLRPFDPRTDTVFLSNYGTEAFATELLNMKSGPDIEARNISTANPALPRLAITSAGLDVFKGEIMGEVFDHGGNIGVICVVDIACEERSTIRELEDMPNTRVICDLGAAPCARLVWKSRQETWESPSCESFGDKEALSQLKQLVEGLNDPRTTASYYDLEIQRVHLIPH